MTFDIEGAKKAGYSDAEIADHLGKQSNFDVAAARKAGYSDAELLTHLSAQKEQPKEQPGFLERATNVAQGVTALHRAAAMGVARTTGIPQLIEGDVAGAAASPFVQFAVKAGEPIIGVANRLAGNTDVIPKFNALAAEGGAKPMNAAGMAGSIMNPIGLATAGAMGPAATLPGQMAQGAAQGAIGGFLSDAKDNYEASKNALWGAGLGSLAAPVVRGLVGAGNWAVDHVGRPIVNMFSPQGPTNIARDIINRDVGAANVPATIAAANAAPEIIPGGNATVSQATAGLPQASPLSAIEKRVAAAPGGPSAKFGERALEQQDAVSAAEAARKAASDANYGKAFAARSINTPLGSPASKEIQDIAQNPYFQDAIPAAEKLATAKGLKPDQNLTEMLHDVKIGLDKKLAATGDASLDLSQRREVQLLKERLVKWMETQNPEYQIARQEHATASKAIKDFTDRNELAASPLQPTNIGSGMVSKASDVQVPHLLSTKITMLNYAAKLLGQDMEPKVNNALADIMLDPAKYSQVMSALPKANRLQIQDALKAANLLSFSLPQMRPQ